MGKPILPCATAVLICVYLIILSKATFRELGRVSLYDPKPLRKPLRHDGSKFFGREVGAFTNTSNFTVDRYTPKQRTNKSYSYDIAIVSMAEYWYAHSSLPREIYCKNTSKPILIRYAKEEEENIKRAEILIFSGRLSKVSNVKVWNKLQRLRQSGQLWVHTTEESPFNSLSICPSPDLDIRFNLSYTYHPEADISSPYGRFIPFQQNQIGTSRSNFNKKSKLMVWVSSHCSTKMWRRSDFAHDLAKHLPLDTYGACGTFDCPKHKSVCTKIFQNYKFYLAMENSCCGGYITEKFWDALTRLKAIPVVVGAPKRDYEKLAPNNSFIHADDFGSIKELAEFVIKVSKSKELYDSYFQWKRLGTAKSNPISSVLAFNDKSVCRIIDYIKSSSAASLAACPFDPYGPNWFGGCYNCGERDWLRNYSTFDYDLKMKIQTRNI